ncbi:hypothetical protein BH23CHL2_BH23CHL2_18140 [soil metagenome]
MANSNTEVARTFHEATKYRQIDRGDGQFEGVMGIPPDFQPSLGEQSPDNEPHPFKIYTDLDSIDLPDEFDPLTMPLLDAIAMSGAEESLDGTPDLAKLARISLLSNGILKRGSHGTGREIFYRAAGSTGARYHLELYYVCGDLEGLDAGVYHYAADTHSLGVIRSGDFRAAVVGATGAEPSVAEASALLIVTSTFWRNAWRYKERAYRHTYWDLGTTLGNVLAVATAEHLQSKVVLGFHDTAINELLGVDGQREAAVASVPLGRGHSPGSSPEIERVDHPVEPVSNGEFDFPLIWEMHAESSLSSGNDAANWRSSRVARSTLDSTGDQIALSPIPDGDRPDTPVDETIRRRRSTRHYTRDEAIPFDSFSTMLDHSSQPIAFDCLDADAHSFTDPYLIVNDVDGLEPGSYAVHPERGTLELLATGDFRDDASRLAVGQGYPADAHVNVYYLADLDPIFDAYGNRGWRIAQLEGALRAQKLHLAAHTLGLGAVGSTSLDDEVTDFFSPHAAGKGFMFIVVFGRRKRRSERQ